MVIGARTRDGAPPFHGAERERRVVSSSRSLVWERLDTFGTDLAVLDDAGGLSASGTAIAAAALPHVIRYELDTDPDAACRELTVRTEGAGWRRGLWLRRDGLQWRLRTEEEGDLDGALRSAGRAGVLLPGIESPDRLTGVMDVRVAHAPLFVTPLLRRVRLTPGADRREVLTALVLEPSLTVVTQTVTLELLDPQRLSITTDHNRVVVGLDEAGFALHYPGLAQRLA